MHFWIDKRSQANINQCRANARLTLNRLQPLEYVRPPHHQHHHNSNSSASSSNNSNYNYNYLNLNSSNNNNNNNNNGSNINNSILRSSNLNVNTSNIINSTTNRVNRVSNNNNNNNNIGNPNICGNSTALNNPTNINMINTAATSSAHSSYRIPHHPNIDIEPTFGPNDQHNQQEPVVRTQPHLRWQVLVIFTFFVVTIRFYVLGNRSEVLIYCISGLILVMALLIFSALNLQKRLTNGNNNFNATSPRFDGVQHTRLISANNRLGGVIGTNSAVHQQEQIATGSRCPYVQQLVLQNATGSLSRNGINRDAQILAEAVVLLPPSPTHFLHPNDIGRHHSENSIAPPPYDKAILLPSNSNKNKKFVGIEIESSEDETPPPSYAAVTDISN